MVGDSASIRRTRLIGGRGVEAAGCGGAGMRTVRQRNPTWALRCPAFPSLKYYSVRVEREEREREPRSPLRENPRRRFHVTISVLSPPPRRESHTLVSRSPRGCFVVRTYVLLFIFFYVRSFAQFRSFRSFRSSVRPLIRSFAPFLDPMSEQHILDQGDRRTSRHQL